MPTLAPAAMSRREAIWTWVERASNVGILIAAALLGVRFLVPSPQPPGSRDDLISPGEHLTLDLSGPQPRPKAFVAFRATCSFCVASTEFYREVLRDHGRDSLAFLTPLGEEGQTVESLKAHGVEARVLAADFVTNKLVVTPLLLVVDSGDRVVKVWRGRLSAAQQLEVKRALGRSMAGR